MLALLLFISPVSAQLNAYKYIVVPKQFEAFNRPNQHQTSTMVKYFLTEKGLPAVWNDARPSDLVAEPCQGLMARLVDDSNMLVTKVRIRFVDCGEAVIYETAEGRSKLKEYKEAYREAIEESMQSLNGMNYSYQPPEKAPETTMNTAETKVAATPEVPSPPVRVEPTVTEAEETAEVVSDPPAAVSRVMPQTSSAEDDLLYAQETEDGYQLVDGKPSVRLQLLKTSRPDTYIALSNGQPMGSVFKDGTGWIHEYYQDGKLVRQALNIRFY